MKHATMMLAMLAACSERDVFVGDLQEVMVVPTVPNRNVDILFVVDSSPSMGDQQAALAASFPQMMDALSTLDGGLPNVHIGVITTDMGVQTSSGTLGPSIGTGPGACTGIGDDGVLRSNAPELAGAMFISDIADTDGTRIRNYTGELRDVFAQLATVGANGCGFEQPLAAVRRAIENPANAGFIRPEANLAIVILSDEDDCSVLDPQLWGSNTTSLGVLGSFRCTRFGVTCDGGGATPDDMNTPGAKTDCHSNPSSAYVDDVATFTSYLTAVKQDPYAVMIGAIVGDPTSVTVELGVPPGGGTMVPMLGDVCALPGQWADPAVRIAQAADAFPARSAVASICGDLVQPLTQLGYTAKKLVGDPCVDTALADTSAEPGSQTYCEVVEGPLDDERLVPPCDNASGTDCWRLTPDPERCATVDGNLRLDVRRSSAPAPRSYTHLRCLTAAR